MLKRATFLLAASLALLPAWRSVAQQPTPQSLNERAVGAYRSGDYAGYLRLMQQLASLLPNHPRVLFNLAGALALNGDAASTAAVLQRLAAMNVVFDVKAEKDFDRVRSDPAFQQAAAAIDAAGSRRVANAEVAFRFPERDLITEAVVHDATTDAFFVSSIRKKKILRVRRGVISDFATTGDFAPLGMAIDRQARLLWVAASAFERMEGFAPALEGRAALFAVSLDDGRIVRRIETGGFLDSVAVLPDHTVLVSDARGTLLILDDVTLRPLVTGRMRSPQAIAPSASPSSVYVADYGGAIWHVDVRTGDALRLPAPTDVPMAGIDGLALAGNALIAVMNGVEPNRVVRLALSRDGNAIERADILEMNTEPLDEPTNGTMVGPDFYFVAASQGHRFDGETPPDPATLAKPAILRIRQAAKR